MNSIVSPSILSCDFTNIESELAPLKDSENTWVHLDIMDGHFVPNLTFGIPVIKQIAGKCSLPLDAHLMVSNPEFHIEEMKDFGLQNITFHIEACADPLELIKKAKRSYPCVGISIKPKTPISSLSKEILEVVGLVLIMSVEPGFGGQSFIENTYTRVKELNELREACGYKFQIQVDGGVTNKNARKLRETGADNLVAGSYIFKGEKHQYSQLVETLR
jgi:ribulose-phosphate 3-epimerase